MDERQIGLVLALKELEASLDISSFDSRLILQKTVYLVQAAGIRLGYTYNWYHRGPYSPALTRDVYELSSDDDFATGWVLDECSKENTIKLRSLLDATPNDPSKKSRQLELLASLHYLARRRHVDITNCEAAKKQLEANDKHFSTEEITTAIAELQRVKLV